MNDPFSTARAASLSGDIAEKMSFGLEQRAANTDQARVRDAVLAEALKGFDGASVLEIGCGTGPICRAVAAMDNVARVIGSEPSPALLQRARELAPPGTIEWLECFGSSVPLPDESIDLVIIWTVLTHVPTDMHGTVLAEAFRLLKKGGRVVLFDNDACSWTIGLTDDDVLQKALDICTSILQDKYLARKFPSLLASAGFLPGKLQIHPVLDDSKDSYGFSFLSDRVPFYAMVAELMNKEEAELVKQESVQRVDSKTFQLLLSYGSIIGQKPK